MPRRNNFRGSDSRGRRPPPRHRQPRNPGITHQPPVPGLLENPISDVSSFSEGFLERLRGRLSGTFVDNFGNGDVNIFTYGANTDATSGTSVDAVVPKPTPDSEPTPSSESEVKPVEPNPNAKPETKPVEPNPNAKPETIPETKPVEEVLTVKTVNLKVPENGAAHRTNKYDISATSEPSPKLVVRRGQPFSADIEFSRTYDEKVDDLKIICEAGDKPLKSKGTYVEFVLSAVDTPKEWGAKITSTKDNVVTVDILTPPTCFIGKWMLKIDVIKKEETVTNILRYQHKDPVYIIFNPWCPDDAVYMPDQNLLNEYVLNETGRIYVGSKTNMSAKPWNFGQFETCVLDVALSLLDISVLNWSVRGNPIPVIRKLSAMVNSVDDGGLLAGNWSGDYADGTSPLTWTGSVAILEEYWKSKQSVCYGQCWVFSAVSTTLCRTLGIPTRCVTNFESAHDTDGSITIDIHFKANGELDNNANMDSVWNFHCWNESYMTRPDLPAGYGGWQAFDSTPQETSDGVYCGGPTSVLAVLNGEVNLPYDGSFVFAEVNSDRLYWKPDKLGVMQCTYVDKKAVGKNMSTKAADSNKREDLTDHYKYPEGSAEERAAVLKANQVGSTRHDIYKKTVDDVKFKVVQDPENSWVGASFIVGLSMKNNSTVKRTISGRICVRTMFYTGVTGDKLKSEPFINIVLKPGQEQKQMVEVKQDDYDGKLKDCCMMDVAILAHVDETEQNYTIKENYTLRKPHLSVKAPSDAIAGKEIKIDVSFANPLNSSLTGCVVTVDGVCPAIKFSQGNVAPAGTFTTTLPITPTKVGNNQEIIICFNSKQLEDINTFCPINIRE